MNKLIDLPVLKDVCLPWAFFYTDSISENSSLPLPLSPIDINEELRFYTQKRSIDQSSSNNDCSILSIVSFTPSSQSLSTQHQNQTLHTPFSFSPSPKSTSPTTSAQSDLDLSSLVNQLSASTDFNDLRQKMTKIENSKVSPLPNPTHPLDKGLRRPSQTPTRETREKGILSPYSSPT